MTDHPLVPATASDPSQLEAGHGQLPVASAGYPADLLDESGGGGISMARVGRALLRYKWLLVLAALLGGGGAYVAWHMIDPDYVANGNLWIEPDRGGEMSPIAESELLGDNAWIELLRSFSVLDPVVLEERLYLQTTPNWRWLFQDFGLADRFRPGSYRLEVAEEGGRWTLKTDGGVEVENGAMGDSIGKTVGFAWRPGPRSLEPGALVKFTVVTPRDASSDLGKQLVTRMNPRSNFIALSLPGKDPSQIASVLNSLMKRHVELAAELKRKKLDERRSILQEQLTSAQQELERAEGDLEAFRVATITLPGERDAVGDPAPPIAAGIQQTRDPVFSNFFQMKILQDNVARDARRLREILAEVGDKPLPVEPFEMIGSVGQSAQLNGALQQLVKARGDLRSLQQRYQDEYRPIQDLKDNIQQLEKNTIPGLVEALAKELDSRAAELATRIAGASVDLSNIPARSIEEARLTRQVMIQQNLYNDLRLRVETARLAAVSSVPDVSILDEARTPQVPANDRRIRTMLMIVMGVFGAGAAAAVALDRLDPTLRDPTELPGEIGLAVLGAVPKIGGKRPFNEARVLDAFRELRMRVEFAHGRGPLVFTISSASQAEGKSLICANLALVFAEVGRKTLLIDGDTRRGDVNALLGAQRKPGLTDCLAGAEIADVVQSTSYARLDFVGSGSRKASSPELLAGERLRELFSHARTNYDVVIVDSPPLTAGADAALLAALTGSLVVVVRSGATLREMVLAKLQGLRRFPIRVLGGILNDFAETGKNRYLYYSNYLPGYEATGEADPGGEMLVGAGSKTETEPLA